MWIPAAALLAACPAQDERFGNPDAVSEVPFRLAVVDRFRPPPEGGFAKPADLVAADGRVWIVDHGANRIFEYGREGAHRATFSREGEGPGELDGPLAVGALSDTLWVYNAGNRRIEFVGFGGAPLGTQPMPEGAGAVVDMLAVGGEFVAARAFGHPPLIRFRRAAGSGRSEIERAFGAELARREREIGAGAIPSVYRLARIGDRLWVMHLYLPLVGIYELDGTFVRTVTYPSPPVRTGGERRVEVEGRQVRLRDAPPDPAGAIGALPGPSGEVYLLTHQRKDGVQGIYVLSAEGELVGRAANPVDGVFAFAESDGDRRFVVGTRGPLEEPTVFILAPSKRR